MTSDSGSKHAHDTPLDENDVTKIAKATTTGTVVPPKNPTHKAMQQKPLLQMAGTTKPPIASNSHRTMLNDKSNRDGQTSSASKGKGKETTAIQHQPYPSLESDHTQEKSSLSPSAATDTKASSHLPNASEQQGQQQQQSSSGITKLDVIDTNAKATVEPSVALTTTTAAAEAAVEATVLKDFFKDNQQRYNDKLRSPMQPTTILPIIVPDRMKPPLREKYLSSSSKKRSYDSMDDQGEQLLATRKQQRRGKQGVDYSKEQAIDSESHTTTTSATSTAALSPSSSHKFSSQQPIPSFSALESRYDQPSTTSMEVSETIYKEAKELDEHQEYCAQQRNLQDNTTTTTTTQHHDDPATQRWMKDPMLVADYADDINAYLRATEGDTVVDPEYMKMQHEVTWHMRDVLVDWVSDIHYIFHLLPETFFLAVNIIDRFLAKRVVSLGALQLLGITSLFVASKFEETLIPPMSQYIYMTGNTVTEEDLLKSERYILQVLDFKLCHAHPLHFLRRCTMMGEQFDFRVRLLAKYLMEITYIDHRFLGTPPSLVAASALWLSMKILDKGPWTSELDKMAGYTVQDLKSTVELTLDYLSQPIGNRSFFKKWASTRMLKVSVFVRDWVERLAAESN